MKKMKYNPLAHLEQTCLLLLFILIILPPSAFGQETYRFERMWPTLLQPWYFKYPQGIAVGPDESVYIVDSGFCRIQKFTPDGQFITRWGNQGTGDGEFGYYDPLGPSSIAVDSNGYVYVTDIYNNRIQRFTSDGVFLNKWGELGYADGQFMAPSGIAVDPNGFVYVSDWGNCRIQKFTSDGSFVTKWGDYGTGNGQFNKPSAITVDADNYVYVADSTDDLTRIQKFTSDGTFILKWDNDFPGGARWGTIGGLAVDENRNIYITDVSPKWNEEGLLVTCVYKIDPEGRLIITWERKRDFNDAYVPPGAMPAIALDHHEHIYLVDCSSHSIVKRILNFEIINVWASYTTGDDAFMQSKGICVTDNGTIYVTDCILNVIHIFSPEGTHSTWGSPGAFNDPRNITVDHTGDIYVCDRRYGDFNYRIQKFSPDRQYITTIWGRVNDLLSRPEAIALDSSGNVYVADQIQTVVPCDPNNTPPCIELRHRIQKFKLSPDGIAYTPDIPWETWGNGNTFLFPSGIAVGRDTAGTEYVYVADTWNNCIHKFTLNNDYITTWFEAAPNDTFNMPKGLATDDAGNVYVADSWNCRFLKFNSEGELITSLGSCGSSSNQMSEFHYLAVDSNEKVFVADTYNNRIQVFTKAENVENSRAIIVAGGGAYSGNSLWDATQMCASFAYRALTNQGFTKDYITYLSEDTDLDLDDNRISDDGIVVPSNVSLRDAIQDAAENNAENLVLYLTDHGGADENGDGTFNLGGSEILTASGLASMLDSFPGRIIVIIDACQSGSFMDALQGPPNRIIITSAGPGEQAKFINQGTISFSNFFWTGVFNGSSIWDSYNTASGAVHVLASQTPQLWPLDDSLDNVYIGNHIGGMVGDAPVIGSIATSPPELHLETSATLHANTVTDLNGDGIARVWAVIWPPHFDPGSVDNPLTDLPSVDLLPTGVGGNYAGTYNGFISMGIYNIAVYAMDRKGNTSQPNFMTLSRNLTRRAVIVAGGAGGELSRAMIEKNTSLAYHAFIAQYYNPDDIYFMSVTTFLEDVITYLPTVNNLESHLYRLANDEAITNLDLTIYLIGSGDTRTFTMNDDPEGMNDYDKFLTSDQLKAWLDVIQGKPSRVTIIYDGNKSGSFIPSLMPPENKERIIITSTGPESDAYFKTEGSISFSSFFWDRIAAGTTIGDAYLYAKRAISYCTRDNEISFSCYRPQHPLIDANGNGIANEPVDETTALGLNLGDGIVSADEPPLIGSVSAQRQGNLLTITAEITSINPVEQVWAVIRPIGYCPGASEELPQEVVEAELLDLDGDGTYEGSRSDVNYPCKVTVYAMNRDDVGETNSSSLETRIIQPGGDIYEPDNDASQANVIVVNHPSPQPHTLHYQDDEDRVKFYGVRTDNGHTYTIEAGNIGGVSCPVVIELYRENLGFVDDASGNPVEGGKVWLDFECPQNGIYYVRVLRGGGCAYIEGEMSYDLKVYDAHQEETASIAGKVENSVTGEPIDGAIITSNGTGAAISVHGEYLLSEVPGRFTITARKGKYESAHYGVTIDSPDQYIRRDIEMDPRDTGACSAAADCDDGLFCNGTETCVNRTCQPGTPPCADDGVFCNGTESCNEETDACEHAGNPCPQDLTCDEGKDACTGCVQDAQCDDGLYCNGVESCLDGTCIDGADPCSEGVECDEEGNACLVPDITVTPRAIMQSRWIPLPFFMSIRGTNTHFSGASGVAFSPPSVMPLPIVINEHTLFCMCLIMPAWITGQINDSLEVKVTTGLEQATGSIEVNLMPFMLGGEKQESGNRSQ